jgi:DNA-binding transcriptional MerR regulator
MTTNDAAESTADLVSSTELAQRARISYRQLDHWTRKGYIPGFERDVHIGSGYLRHYDEGQVSVVMEMAKLVHAGITVEVASMIAIELVDSGSAQLGPHYWISRVDQA